MKKVGIELDLTNVEDDLTFWLEETEDTKGLRSYAENLRGVASVLDSLAFILVKYQENGVEMEVVGEKLVISGPDEMIDEILEEGFGDLVETEEDEEDDWEEYEDEELDEDEEDDADEDDLW